MQIAYESCPLCKSEFKTLMTAGVTHHPLWHAPLPEQMEWSKCTSCGHVFSRNYWDEQGLKELFLKSNDSQIAEGITHGNRHLWSLSVDRAMGLLGGYKAVHEGFSNPSWLDVGFGNGALVMVAAEYGFNSVGIDARGEAVGSLQSLGYNASCVQFDEYSGGPFSVVSMCDVLEHLPYPRESLKKVHELIDPKGLLMISLPNMDCAHWRIMDRPGSIGPYWSEIEHYHNFSRESLTRLLIEEGFRLVDYSVSSRYIACMEVFATPI